MATAMQPGKWKLWLVFVRVQFRTHCYSPTTVNISEIILALIFRSRGASLREQRKKKAIDHFIG